MVLDGTHESLSNILTFQLSLLSMVFIIEYFRQYITDRMEVIYTLENPKFTPGKYLVTKMTIIPLFCEEQSLNFRPTVGVSEFLSESQVCRRSNSTAEVTETPRMIFCTVARCTQAEKRRFSECFRMI